MSIPYEVVEYRFLVNKMVVYRVVLPRQLTFFETGTHCFSARATSSMNYLNSLNRVNLKSEKLFLEECT